MVPQGELLSPFLSLVEEHQQRGAECTGHTGYWGTTEVSQELGGKTEAYGTPGAVEK